MDIESHLNDITNYAQQWVHQQILFYNQNSSPLGKSEAELLKHHFHTSTISNTRLSFVESIENPTFYSELQKAGISNLINFNDTAGITFGNNIVISRKFEHTSGEFLSLLFHEMVHVVQYEILGIEKFIFEYFNGWIKNGYSYYKIPLEEQAYKLQARFDKKLPPFSVKDEVLNKFRGLFYK